MAPEPSNFPAMDPKEIPTRQHSAWIAWLPLFWIVLGLLFSSVALRSTIPLWPGSVLGLETFIDASSGGRSASGLDTSNGDLHLAVRLDSGAKWPVAGAILTLAPHGMGLDLSAPGKLRLDLDTGNLASLQICLVEEIPDFTVEDQWQTARYDCQELDMTPGQSSYALPLEHFLTPEWWYSNAKVDLAKLGPEKRQGVVRMILQSGGGTPLRDLREVRISRMDVRSLHWMRAEAILGSFLLLSLANFLLILRARRRKQA